MDLKIGRIGRIEVIDASDTQSLKLFKKEHHARETLYYDGEEKTIFSTYEDKKEKKLVHLVKNEAVYYALFLDNMDVDNGYYFDEKARKIFILKREGKHFFIYYKENINSSIGELEIIDTFFEGDSAFKINDDYISIKKENVSFSKKEMILLAISIILVLTVVYFYFFNEEEKAVKVIPPPPSYSLSPEDINKLKHYGSIQLISDYYSMINSVFNNILINSRIRRISFLQQKEYTVVNPERALKRGNGTYYYQNEKLKKGAIKVSTNLVLHQKYAGVGFKYNTDGVYIKEDTMSTTVYESDIEKYKDIPLTQQCILKIIDFSKYRNYDESKTDKRAENHSLVYERKENSIYFKINRIRPSVFLAKARDILRHCPLYIQEMSADKGYFYGELVLYNVKTNKDLNK